MQKTLPAKTKKIEVREVLCFYLRFSPYMKKRLKYKLEPEHIEFLTNQETLRLWAGMSLQERAKAFHRTYTDRWTYPVAISKVYREHGIKLKKVRILKSTGSQTFEQYLD